MPCVMMSSVHCLGANSATGSKCERHISAVPRRVNKFFFFFLRYSLKAGMHKSVQSLLNWTKVRRHMTVLIETLLNNSKIHSVCFLWSLNCKLLGLSAFLCDERSCQRWTFHSPVVFILSVFKKYSSRSVKMETLLFTHKPTQFITLA